MFPTSSSKQHTPGDISLLATAAILKQFSVNNKNGMECCQGLGLWRYTTNLGSLHWSASDKLL